MDSIKISSTQSAGQFKFNQSHKVIKFLLSVSVFSILLSYSSLIPFFLHSFNSSRFSINFDKNYMFLLCNGLLVFIVKNSGLIGTSPPGSSNPTHEEHDLKSVESRRKAVELAETEATKSPKAKEVVNVEINQVKANEILVSVEEEKRVLIAAEEEDECCRNDSVVVVDHDLYEEEGVEVLSAEELNKKSVVVVDHDLYEEEGVEVLSAEELNKKCDDFIRRMKEGIKLEVQQSIMF